MASIIQKLLKKTPSAQTITSLRNQSQSLDLRLSLFVNEPQFLDRAEKSPSSDFSQTLPTFPFGLPLNPISSTGFVKSEVENASPVDNRRDFAELKRDVGCSQNSLIYPMFQFGCVEKSILLSGLVRNVESDVDDPRMIWADSVKKKRKKKMNKHKYKKLKKSLRRKT